MWVGHAKEEGRRRGEDVSKERGGERGGMGLGRGGARGQLRPVGVEREDPVVAHE